MARADDRLHFTPDDEANALVARDPFALLVGFALDQQVPVQKAFSSPLELKRRLGALDPAAIAAMETGELERVFAERPALHRFPAAMARRVQELAQALVSEHGGRAERVWTEAADARDLKRRLLALPGMGDMKTRSLLAVLAKRLGVELDGWDDVLPRHPTLGDVDSPQALEDYQAAKRAHKAACAPRRRDDHEPGRTDRMRLTFSAGAAAALLALAGCGGGGGGGGGGAAEGGIEGSQAAVEMVAVNDSNEFGTASLFSEEGGTRVLVDTEGPFDREFEQPAEILKGTCPAPTGEPAFELNTLTDGVSETIIDVPLSELQAGGYVIVVRKSATDDALTECGTIEPAG